MGTPTQHREKAARHLSFLQCISDEFPDWKSTVAFYAAVEFVEGLFALKDPKLHSKSHFDRKTNLRRHLSDRKLNQAFDALYNASLDSRYLTLAEGPTAAEVDEILVGRHLEYIRRYAEGRFAK